MKILFIITRADTVGGVQVHVRDIAKILEKQGHEVLVVTGLKGIYNQNLQDYGVKYICCDSFVKEISLGKDWQTFKFFLNLIQQFKPDLIALHSSKAGILGRLAAKLNKIPCVFTVHGWAFTKGVPQPSRQIYQWIEQLTEPLAAKIICVSEYDRNLGIKAGMKEERLLTIYNGIPDIPQELQTKLENTSSIRLVMVARFDRQKDHITLIKAFQSIRGAELILVGDGPNLEQIQTYINEMGISERVKFCGFSYHVPEILAQAHIFTLISNWEGLPYTIMEAMRAGLPVIASNVGGAGEMVLDGITGYCIPPGDVNLLQEKLESLVENKELREKMGHLGRERYELEFTFEKMYEKTLAVYEKAIKKVTI
jgi:glycosyltransferase involved in cell wall biosynthesis